jgi:SAM-dependent methyltransferase
MKRDRMYKDLAWTWPIISPPEDYVEEAEHFRKTILEHTTIPVKTLLDIGCGGGHIDRHLQKWFEVTGADLNEGMLENARKLNPDIRYLQGDMRDLDLGEEFDAVIIADSILYMTTRGELKAAFETAFRHLKPGGVLVTYAEEWKGKHRDTPTTLQTREKDGVEISFVEDYNDPDTEDTTFDCTFVYLIREKGELRIELDQHICGIFSLDTWEKVLAEAGFEVIQLTQDPEDDCTAFVGLKPQ